MLLLAMPLLAAPSPAAAPSLAAAPAPTGPAGFPGLDEARIDAAFSAYARSGSPGCATGIVMGGSLAWARGYGLASLEHEASIGPATVFDLGSTSKQMTAAAVALLARDGRLTLDDGIRKYVPEIPAYGAPITIRHLLTHTSGLRDYTDLLALSGMRDEDLTTTADALAILERQRGVNFAPGAEYRYCNSGFFLASIIVERVAGKSLRAFAQERLFGPLGMDHTLYFDDHALVVPRRATGYAPRPGGGFSTAASDWEQTGDGGVQSSVEDMARWAAMFDAATDGAAAEGAGRAVAGAAPDAGQSARPIPAAWLRGVLETPGRLADGTTLGYGLGLSLDTHRGLRLVRHGGAWAGYRAMLMRVPERRLAVVTLCNVGSADTTTLSFAALDAALDALPNPPPAATPPSPRAAGDRSALEPLAGTYYSEPLGESLAIVIKDAALRLGEDGRALEPLGERQFAAPGGGTTISFAAGGTGLSLREAGGADPRPVPFRRSPGGGRHAAGSLKGLAGDYHSDEVGRAVTIQVREGVPRLALPGGEIVDLKALDLDLFESDWGIVRVQRDAAGRPAALALTNRGVVGLRFRRHADGPAAPAGAPPTGSATPPS
jgi:CubicO group peptidase (beta-lactamase class C family)